MSAPSFTCVLILSPGIPSFFIEAIHGGDERECPPHPTFCLVEFFVWCPGEEGEFGGGATRFTNAMVSVISPCLPPPEPTQHEARV